MSVYLVTGFFFIVINVLVSGSHLAVIVFVCDPTPIFFATPMYQSFYLVFTRLIQGTVRVLCEELSGGVNNRVYEP